MWRFLPAVLLLLLPDAASARMKAGPVVMSPHVRAWAAGAGGGGGSDPNFASVVLLLHFEGADASTTVIDSSSRARSVTTSNMSISTAQQKFGTSSLSNSASNGSVVFPDDPDWSFGVGQFTIEAWVRPSVTVLGTGIQMIVCQSNVGVVSSSSWAFRFFGGSGGFMDFVYTTNGTTEIFVSGAYLPPVNVWTHIAVDRDASNVVRLYADGVVKASGTAAANLFNSTRQLTVGNEANVTTGFIGNIDDLRITKGVARYGGAFTPPMAPFADH